MGISTDYPTGVRRPRQQRSSKTLERILDTAEALLDGRSFDDITILEIIDAAEVSASSLYGRFGDKEALLRALHVRHIDRVRRLAESTAGSALWDELTLEEICRRLIGTLIAYRRTNEQRIRTFRQAERRHADFEERRHALDVTMIATAANYFERRLADDGRSFDRRGFTLAVYLLACSIEAAAGAPAGLASSFASDDEWLTVELTRMMTGFLDLRGEA